MSLTHSSAFDLQRYRARLLDAFLSLVWPRGRREGASGHQRPLKALPGRTSLSTCPLMRRP